MIDDRERHKQRRFAEEPVRSVTAVPAACCLLAASLVLNYFCGMYAAIRGRNQPSLTADLLLSLLPHYDAQTLFVWGFGAFVVLAVVGCAIEQHRAAYIIWMYALLIALRSCFIILTPMGPPPAASLPKGDVLFDLFGQWLTFGNDLFFSSHTSMPFLGFLVYQRLPIRVIMLILSIVLGGCTLIGRDHYTIDVVAAFFITYALVQGHDRLVEIWRSVPATKMPKK